MGKSGRTRVLLAISILALGAGLVLNSGWVDVKGAVSLYVVLPVGAVFFGLFLVSRILEQESELHDLEQQHAKVAAEKQSASPGQSLH